MGRALLLICVWVVACGEAASAPASTATTATTPPTTTTTPTTAAPPATAATPDPTAPVDFEVVPQRAHRSFGVGWDDPGGRFSVYWSARSVAIHEPHFGAVRDVFDHGMSGDRFYASVWPSHVPEIVYASAIAGGDPDALEAGGLTLIHVDTGDVVDVDTGGWRAVDDVVVLDAARVVAGATIVELRTGETHRLDLSAAPGEDEDVSIDGDDRAVAYLSPERRRIAVVQANGRITLFDATTLRRTGAVAPREADAEEDPYASSSRPVAWSRESQLVTELDGGAIATVAADGTTTSVPIAARPDGRWELSIGGAPRIRFVESGAVFSLETGAASEGPIDPAEWPPPPAPPVEGAPVAEWNGTANPEIWELDEPPLPPGGIGGLVSLWHAGFAPSTPTFLVTAGRGASFGWSEEGARSIGCLVGTFPLDFAPDGHLVDESGGDCDVRTGRGVRGEEPDPEVASDPSCDHVVAHGGYHYDVVEHSARERERAAEADGWDRFTFTPCGEEDEMELDGAAGADPLRAEVDRSGRIVAMPVPSGLAIWDDGALVTTIEGGGHLVGLSTRGRTLFVRRERDGALLLLDRNGGAIRVEAGPAPSWECDPHPIAQGSGVIALHLASGVRLLDSTTLAPRAEIAAEGTCGMELGRERVLVRRGEEVLAFGLDGAPVGTSHAPADFRASVDGSALFRCADGELEVRTSEDGTVRGRHRADCEELWLSDDGHFAVTRGVGRAHARVLRTADGSTLVVGVHTGDAHPIPYAFTPATGVFWAPASTPHDLFAVRLGPRVLDDPLVRGDEAWSRFHRATLLADFFAGRPLPTP